MTKPAKGDEGKIKQCGWCGQYFIGQNELDGHTQNCEVMLEEQEREYQLQIRRQEENRFWEEEHAAGRL
jgi:hypothetical protein